MTKNSWVMQLQIADYVAKQPSQRNLIPMLSIIIIIIIIIITARIIVSTPIFSFFNYWFI
jgi:hypothetical protein